MLHTPQAKPVGIRKEKLNDVKSLLKYFSSEGKKFFDDYFSKITLKDAKKLKINWKKQK